MRMVLCKPSKTVSDPLVFPLKYNLPGSAKIIFQYIFFITGSNPGYNFISLRAHHFEGTMTF